MNADQVFMWVGKIVIWFALVGVGVAGLALAAVLFDSWILRPRRQEQFKLGFLSATSEISRAAYWFSDHAPTMRLLQEIAKLNSENGAWSVSLLRDKWRSEMGLK